MKNILYFLKQMHQYTGRILYFNLFAMTFVGLLEGLGMLMLIPMISISGIVDFGIDNKTYISIFSFLDHLPSKVVLPVILFIYLILVIGSQFFNRKISVRNAKIQNDFLRNLRVETYRLILNTKWDFFIKNRKSDLINVMLTEIGKASIGTNAVLSFMGSLLFTVIQIGIALWLSPVITAFILFCGAFVVFLNRNFLKKSQALGNRNYYLGREFMAGITDQLNGIKDVKSNSLEPSRLHWFRNITKKMEEEQVAFVQLKSTSQFYYKAAFAFLMVFFIYMALQLFQAQAGQLMLIVLIFSRLWPRVSGIQSSLESIATSIPSFKVVKGMQENCQRAMELHAEDYKNIQPLSLKFNIACKNVSFRYSQDEERYVLQDINVVIPANQTTAIVGKSGAGKSTLIDLIMGLNLPEKGQVVVDGVPITKNNLLSLRQSLSYVPQDPYVFNTTIRENLTLVKELATEEEIWEALNFASAADFVRELPEGLDTVIGDRGIKLSGGERQRLVLARAILRKPYILVLDEATSALDSESESRIQQSLELLRGKMTIIVIAHRLSTIRNADQVFVIDQGKVIQQGGFHQLAQEKGKVFSLLLDKQMGAIH